MVGGLGKCLWEGSKRRWEVVRLTLWQRQAPQVRDEMENWGPLLALRHASHVSLSVIHGVRLGTGTQVLVCHGY